MQSNPNGQDDNNPFGTNVSKSGGQGSRAQGGGGSSVFVRTSQLQQQQAPENSEAMYQVREIPEVKGAVYDELGFYNLPDGSFYDPDGHYFDLDGYDEYGGYYDENDVYVPGEGNKHLFNQDATDGKGDDRFDNDELAAQLEDDDAVDARHSDHLQDKMYQQFLKESKKNGESFVDQDYDDHQHNSNKMGAGNSNNQQRQHHNNQQYKFMKRRMGGGGHQNKKYGGGGSNQQMQQQYGGSGLPPQNDMNNQMQWQIQQQQMMFNQQQQQNMQNMDNFNKGMLPPQQQQQQIHQINQPPVAGQVNYGQQYPYQQSIMQQQQFQQQLPPQMMDMQQNQEQLVPQMPGATPESNTNSSFGASSSFNPNAKPFQPNFGGASGTTSGTPENDNNAT